MIHHFIKGPDADGMYLVGHIVPGCDTFHVDCPCRTLESAEAEAKRLNAAVGEVRRLEVDLTFEEREA